MATSPRRRPEPTCTVRCHSMDHAEKAIAAITMSFGTDEQVADYLESLCANYLSLVDWAGRNVLHLAASCNRWRLIRWLLTSKKRQMKADAINFRDKESGWTPVHRAVFYGQLCAAKVLIEHCSNLSILDWDCVSPLHLATMDRPPYMDCKTAGLYEAYVWGINDNYNLGLGIHQSRESPELVEFFRKEKVNIKHVVMCKFHTIFLSMSGKVYTCGHGQGGRLGHSSERAVIVPQLVKFGDGPNQPTIVSIAASTDHSAFLAENGIVWTCGLNSYRQLGHCSPPPSQLLTPRMMDKQFFKGHTVVGVSTGICHTVIHADDAIFTFGLNAGQLGHPESGDVLQTDPKRVAALNFSNINFIHVVASDGATVCATQNGDVYTLHEYKCRKVASKQRDIVHICVSGGHLDSKRYQSMLRSINVTSEMRILFLTKCGRIFLWSESHPNVTRCVISLGRLLRVSHLALFNEGSAVFTTDEGEGFIGHFKKPKTSNVIIHRDQLSSRSKTSKNFSTFIEHDDCFHIHVTRLANVFRGVRVACDNKGQNFCVTQAHPKVGLLEVPTMSPCKMSIELNSFLSDADINDSIHDAVIEVDHNLFAAHCFILTSRSDYFRRKILEKKSKTNDIFIIDCSADVSPAIFKQILKYIYTDDCDLLADGFQFENVMATQTDYSDFTFAHSNQPDLVVSTLNDTHKISAFRMAQDDKKSESGVRSPKSGKNKRDSDPVSQLREAAKKFGVAGLLRKLNCVAYIDEKVAIVEPLPVSHLRFDRHKFPELCDVCIISRSGREINAHKCILVARSEYFNSMFGCSWLETSSSVNLPISSDIIELVVGFLYGDDSEHFRRADDAEFFCNVLVVADLFLVTRLKELCEVVLCDLLTLKNVVEMVEFSILYNANQLKLSCMNFISLNLPAFLESKSICGLSDDALEELTKSYRQLIPQMGRRVITSCSSFQDIKFEDPVSFDMLDAMLSKEDSVTSSALTKLSGGRTKDKVPTARKSLNCFSTSSVLPRPRTVSTSSVGSDVDKKGKRAPSKVKRKSDDLAKSEIVEHSVVTEKPVATPSKWFNGSEDMDHAFPDLLNELRISTAGSTPQSYLKVHRSKSYEKEEPTSPTTSHTTKLSQKQRKKLARDGVQPTSSPMPIPHSLMMEKYGKSSTWGHDERSSGMISLKDIMSRERTMSIKSTSSSVDALRTGFSDSSETIRPHFKESTDDGLTVTVNVWQKKTAEEVPRFADIVKMEEERRIRLERMQTKQLHFIQMEDRAMNELLTFYKNRCDHDENVVVERILPDCVATPVWKQTK